MSREEKRARLLGVYHEDYGVFTYAEVEKRASKAGRDSNRKRAGHGTPVPTTAQEDVAHHCPPCFHSPCT